MFPDMGKPHPALDKLVHDHPGMTEAMVASIQFARLTGRYDSNCVYKQNLLFESHVLRRNVIDEWFDTNSSSQF